MKKIKITGNQIRLILCLIIVAIISLSYNFVYIKYENLAEDYRLRTKNTELQITQSQKEITQQDAIKVQTKEMTEQGEDIIDKYPVYIAKEDDLIFIEEMEKELGIDIPSSNISVLDNVVLYTTGLPIRDENGKEIIGSGDSSQGADNNTQASIASDSNGDNSTAATGDVAMTAEEDISSEAQTDASAETPNSDTTSAGAEAGTSSDTAGQQYMTCLKSQITISFQTTYQDFKKLVNYINEYPVKTSISNTSLIYDSSTGNLMASMTINRFALTGTGKVYEEPYIGDISIGTDNLFGTVGNGE